MDCLTIPINLSNCPPHQGARLRLNCHLIPSLHNKLCTRSSFIIALSHFAAATNVPPLSEYIFFGHPRRATNLFKLCSNSSVAIDVSTSRYSALVRPQAYTIKYPFPSLSLFLRYLSEPAKSIPTTFIYLFKNILKR